MIRYVLTPDAAPLLRLLVEPGEREEVLTRIEREWTIPRARLEAIFDALLDSGALAPESQATAQPARHARSFGDIVYHRLMLADEVRNAAFRRAISAIVRPGDVVIDVGAGSGLLSFLAARAGAGKVYGLEATGIIEDARRICADNGLTDRVELIACDAAVDCHHGPADVVLGEWAGMFLLDEWRHLDAFARVRDASLVPGGAVIPRRARLYLSPISDRRLYIDRGLGFWEQPLEGLDVRHGRDREIARLRAIPVEARARGLLGEPWQLLDLDCARDDSRAYLFESASEMRCDRAAMCHGYIGHFSLNLAPGILLDTSPLAPPTHWEQTYFPMAAFPVQAGDLLLSHARTTRSEATGSPTLMLTVELRRGPEIVHRARHVYPVGDRLV